MTSLLGAVVTAGVVAATTTSTIPRWLWWFTAVAATVLTVGGTLEGLDVVPDGRFAAFLRHVGLHAGFALFAAPAAEPTSGP